VYVGGYDWGANSYPFLSYELDREDGSLAQLDDPIDLGPNPSFIMPDASGQYLYIANEVDGDSGGVTVAAIDRDTGALSWHDHESTGSGFVFTALDPAGEWVLAASYSDGNVSVFPVADDGTLGGAVDTQDLGGNAHAVRVDASGKWAYVPNLAQNQVEQLAFIGATGQLDPNPTMPVLSLDGGPRHIAFSPDGNYAYVMCELEPILAAFEVPANGVLAEVDREPTVPAGTQERAGAHVLVHPSGDFVYVSNRDQHSIGVFSVGADGKLELVEHEDTRGVHPRNFDIDPTGEFMVVANKGASGDEDGNLSVYRIADDGTLWPLGEVLGGLMEPTGVSIVNIPD
jgi:6-phosphogluconolactonase